jgi:pilus assembly protein CpaE
MIRILVIDDEPINYHLVMQALQPTGYEIEYAENGNSGISKALQIKPDLIITDVMMPDISGYEVTRLLRREDQFANTPILILTAQAGLQDKLKAFEAGADDHLTKPFNAAELSVRVAALLRRAEATQSPVQEAAHGKTARMIAVHSLRGGTGSSTLAVNLAVGLASLWPRSTILLDLTMTAGQVALMLNMTLRRTWADVARFKPDELDRDALQSVIGLHESGLSFIAAPTFPTEAQTLSDETLGAALNLLKQDYEYLIADLPHDFSGVALQALDAADIILMVASPEMASVRAVIAALDTYLKLGYPKEKMKLVLSATFPRAGLLKEKIDAALGMTSIATIPYVQEVFVDAINYGRPPVYYQTGLPISGLLEDFAFHLSKDTHKKAKPDNPTDAWKRVYKRYQERKK